MAWALAHHPATPAALFPLSVFFVVVSLVVSQVTYLPSIPSHHLLFLFFNFINNANYRFIVSGHER